MKNLIMGFGTNQNVASIEVFLRSARAIAPPEALDIFLVTNTRSGLDDLLEETNSKAIQTLNNYSMSTSKYSKLLNRFYMHSARIMYRMKMLNKTDEIFDGYMNMLETWHHPQLARWFAYRRILKMTDRYEQIFISDVKDVVFQSSPFENNDKENVSIYEDGEIFQTGKFNKEWYISAYGKSAYDNVKERTPICIGTIQGKHSLLLALIDQFAVRISESPFGKIEQAIFNNMYFNNAFKTPVFAVNNFKGSVATLADQKDVNEKVSIDEIGNILSTETGLAYPVVHMYDRFDNTRDAVTKRFLKT